MAARRKHALNALYEGLLRRYSVIVERRADEKGTVSAATEDGK